MRLRTLLLSALVGTATVVACGRDLILSGAHPPAPVAPNSFAILQGGFKQTHEAVIKVDGREVYKGIPRTNPLLEVAAVIRVQATSRHPIVTIDMPDDRIRGCKQFDLRNGAAVGIGIGTNRIAKLGQAKEFFYD